MGITRFARTVSRLLAPRPQFFQGACPCCGTPTCSIFSDAFTRADSTNIGSDWTETAGDWSIASNKLSIAAANAICICTTTATDANVSISVVVNGTASGTKARILLNYVDSSNYYFAQITFGTNTLILGKVVAGSTTTLASQTATANTSTDYTWVACMKSTGEFSSTFNTVTAQVDVGSPTHGTFGLGTSTLSSGSLTFDTFAASIVSGSCEACSYSCLGCNDSVGPAQWKVVIAGLTNTGSCSNCTDINATYYLDPYDGGNGNRFGRESGTCVWYLPLGPYCSTFIIGSLSYIVLTAFRTITSGKALEVVIATDSGTPARQIQYAITGSPPIDCNVTDLDVPFDSYGIPCNAGTTTCTITAV